MLKIKTFVSFWNKISIKNRIKRKNNKMELEKFEKLKESFEQNLFNKKFYLINKFLHIFSYFGHMASIFMGFFFVYKLLLDAAGDELPTWTLATLSITFLTLFEFIKRYLFHQTSYEMVTKPIKFWKKQVWYLLLFSTLIVGTSFYLGLSGAEKFSNKGSNLEGKKNIELLVIDSTIKVKYKQEIFLIDARLNGVEGERTQIMNEIGQLTEVMNKLNQDKIEESNQWIRNQIQNQINNETRRRDQLKSQITQLVNGIQRDRDSLESKMKREKFPLIEEVNLKYSELDENNQSSSLKFIFIILFIETLILVGIYFKNYYDYESYLEIKNKLRNDEKYQQWKLYSILLPIIYQNGQLKENDKCLSTLKVLELGKMENPNILEKDVKTLFNILAYLDVIIPHSNYRSIKLELDQAKDKLKKYFNIKY